MLKCNAMGSFKIIQTVLLCSLVIAGKCEINECPRFCKCDVFQQLNRADCSSRNLISAEVDIVNVVQILDLSYNNIPAIQSNNFKSYKHLKYLNISHNDIHTLDLEAFSYLRRLVELDLSFNRLQYFDNRLFERNPLLRKLNLEGNKFMSLAQKPFIKSSSLIELNLRNSQIIFINNILLSKLPNLENLDLSQNLLNGFQIEDFQDLVKLETLNLSENYIRCDKMTIEKLQVLKSKGFKVDLDECNGWNAQKSPVVEKFQKMLLGPVNVELKENEEFKENEPQQQWRFNLNDLDEISQEDEALYDYENKDTSSNEWFKFAPDAVLCAADKYKLCHKYRKCLENLNKAWHDEHSSRSFSASEAKFGFFLGVACGGAAAVVLLTCGLCLKNCFANKEGGERRRGSHLEEHLPFDETQPPALGRTPQQLPPQVRRQPRRRAAHTPIRPVVRYEGPVAENFLSRLFGIPARHHYYRTINQNTATLIRRLSRSNLFNNRLSQHFLDRQFSAESNAAAEVTQSSGNATAPRPETPPPCYGDIVINECGSRK